MSTLPEIMQHERARRIIEMALDEDIGAGDATSLGLVDEKAVISADLEARENCRVSGGPVAEAVFKAVDPSLEVETLIPDGKPASAGDVILRMTGNAQAVLTAERTALNFMQRMTGIATMARRFVEAVAGTGTTILDTRKTTPALRVFEKYAVLCGGASNHRMGLYDRVMIKDNHRRLWHKGDPTRLDLAVKASREAFPELAVEVEVETVEELESALRAEPEWILLDNMSCEEMRRCVAMTAGRSQLEASGGITFDRARAVAETGVDAISLGCLTHSAPSADLALEHTL